MKWNRRNFLTLNTYSLISIAATHAVLQKFPEMESQKVSWGTLVLTYNEACLLLTLCGIQRMGTVSQMCICSGIPAQQLIAVQKRTCEFSDLDGAFITRRQRRQNPETRSGCGFCYSFPLWCWGTLLPLSRPSIFSTWKWRLWYCYTSQGKNENALR